VAPPSPSGPGAAAGAAAGAAPAPVPAGGLDIREYTLEKAAVARSPLCMRLSARRVADQEYLIYAETEAGEEWGERRRGAGGPAQRLARRAAAPRRSRRAGEPDLAGGHLLAPAHPHRVLPRPSPCRPTAPRLPASSSRTADFVAWVKALSAAMRAWDEVDRSIAALTLAKSAATAGGRG
jgi:hypothetical protein